MHIYKAKTLFNGAVIGKDSGQYTAVPATYKGEPFIVDYKGEMMKVEDWETADGYRVFEDKFNRNKNYTLGYFKWQPNGKLVEKK